MTTAVNNNPYSALGLSGGSSGSSGTSSTSLGQQDFLKLMTQQLQDQDPLHPVDNAEFFSQIAQFSTVAGITQLNSSFSSLASQLASNQSLQAASLIGHGVLVPGNTVQMSGSGLAGAVEVPASGDVTVSIKSSSGALVGTLDLGVQSAGTVPFSWDGKDAAGNSLPAGTYTLSAQVGSGGSAQAATTDVAAVVNSVSMSSSGALTLNLQGLGDVPFSNVRQIIS
jgi:flagellar basal-body rod modification protein FlgD